MFGLTHKITKSTKISNDKMYFLNKDIFEKIKMKFKANTKKQSKTLFSTGTVIVKITLDILYRIIFKRIKSAAFVKVFFIAFNI